MPQLVRYRVAWSGLSGLPGVSTFYSPAELPGTDINAPLKAFFEAIKTALLPAGCVITYPSVCDIIEAETGTIVDTKTVSAQATTTGAASGAWAAPTGMQVKWRTNGIVAGHRVSGRTFIVPVVSGSFIAGAPTSSAQTTLTNAATALITSVAGGLNIWARPFPGGPGGPARVGTAHQVMSGASGTQAVVLRSRRD